MTNPKRGRGRPVGTHIRDDKALAFVADKMVADPRLKPSTAMWQVYSAGSWEGLSAEAVVARWLRKWRTAAPRRLWKRPADDGTKDRPRSSLFNGQLT